MFFSIKLHQLRYNFDYIETLYHQLFTRSAFRTVPDTEVSKLNWENASAIADSLETIVLSVSSLITDQPNNSFSDDDSDESGKLVSLTFG